MERRSIELSELRLIQTEANENGERTAPVIEGHAAVFGPFSEELGGLFKFRERIAPGAFTETLKNDDIRALWNHNPDYVLGRNKAGTLELEETPRGLKVRIHPPDTQYARDLMESMQRGDVSQMSFAFTTQEESWSTVDGADVRELRKVQLFDVSPVTYPAYTQTDVGVRDAAASYEKRCAEIQTANDAKAKLDELKTRINLL